MPPSLSHLYAGSASPSWLLPPPSSLYPGEKAEQSPGLSLPTPDTTWILYQAHFLQPDSYLLKPRFQMKHEPDSIFFFKLGNCEVYFEVIDA